MNSTVSFIGRRYLRAGTGHRFASLVSLVSFFGLVLGVVALTVVVSVMNGFDRELKQRILGAVPHVVVVSANVAEVRTALGGRQGYSLAPFSEGKALLAANGASMLVGFHGIDHATEASVSTIPGSMVSGELTALASHDAQIVLGEGVARRLGVVTGDRISVIIPGLSPGGALVRPHLETVQVAGTFRLSSELDYSLALVPVQWLEDIAGTPPGVRIRLDDLFAAPAVARSLGESGFTAHAWTASYGDFFEAVRLEKIMMFVLLSFVIGVAAFSIVSGLSMLVDAKRRDIAVLRTMGLPRNGILRVFLYQGAGVAVTGVVVGLLVGVPLAWVTPDLMAIVERVFGFSIVEGTYFDRIPTEIRIPDLIAIAVISLVISFAATLYPSWRAAQLEPARILRYE